MSVARVEDDLKNYVVNTNSCLNNRKRQKIMKPFVQNAKFLLMLTIYIKISKIFTKS